MALKFTLKEMEVTLENAKSQMEKYSSAIESLDSNMKKLQDSLKTTETGIYEALVNKYNEKRQSLFEARDHMIRFCNKLNEKMLELDEAAKTTKASFN